MNPINSTEQLLRPHFLRRSWHLIKPYWCADDRWMALALLLATLVMNAAIVGASVSLTDWGAAFFNALQQYDVAAFPRLVMYFFVILVFFTTFAILAYYFQGILQLRWRRWLTLHFTDKWISRSRYYQLELKPTFADNPDQRISEDIDSFTSLSLSLFIGLFSALITLFSYIFMLWNISGSLSFHLIGYHVVIPHYMVWVAIIYSVLANWIAHLVGRKLISINYYKQKVEANLRFDLIRIRENARAIAQMRGGAIEKKEVVARFNDIWKATRGLITYTKRLTGYSSTVSNLAGIFPMFAAAPQYFAKQISLGTLSQTSSAFGNVQSALSWFINSYQDLTTWRAVIERLDNFNLDMDELPEATKQQGQSYAEMENASLVISNIELSLPQETSPILKVEELSIKQGENTLIEAPSGCGKSLLYGVLAGNWPFWKGRVDMPTSSFFIPQTPYLPIGTLAEVLAYPETSDTYSHSELEQAIKDVGLSRLVDELDEHAHWSRRLSPGEQQRISFARALLRKPEWLFLDEATAALHLDAEQTLYQLLKDRLPNTTLVSIAHKNTLNHFHQRKVKLEGALAG